MNDSSQLVSVVVPAYNAGRTIEDMIHSVLAQTHTDVELIICDDASTDNTATTLSKIRDHRVRVITNFVNGGEGIARDNAIAAARGQWIAVIDADDSWHPRRLTKLLAAAGQRTDCMVFDDLMTCHDTPTGLKPWRPIRGASAFGSEDPSAREVSIPALLRSERLLIKPLIPRKAIVDFEIKHSKRKFGADTEYFLRLAHTGLGLIYVPEPLYNYRVTPGSATAVAATSAFRECISDCAGFGWNSEVAEAFRDKIEMLASNELLYELRSDVMRGNPLAAFLVLARNPKLWRLLPQRIPRYLQYQLHRKLHRGAGR